ncbi:MAG: outer membrane protein [Gemmatimonadales bacterium]|jgi:outer membrane protein|nr:outer membrane protein [Gemmatimonadales bacterium]
MTCWSGLLLLGCLLPTVASAQDSAQATLPSRSVGLSLADALQQARAYSPAYRQVLNDAGPAKWGVRNAYGSLLPSVTASSDLGYTGSGESNFGGGLILPTSAFLTSGYSLGLQWQLSGRSLQAPRQQRALQRATDEDIGAAGVGLTAEISTQYLTALQAAAQVAVARQQVRRNEDFLALARARHKVGQTTLLDVRQAEVTKGTSDVALLRAVQAENEAKLDLLRRMGVEPPVAITQIVLTDTFPVTTPSFQIDSLLALSDQQNPALRSLRARGQAARLDVRAAKTEFLPSLSLRAGWSGFTQQFTNEDLLLSQSLTSAQSQASDCQYNNQVRSNLSLGGETSNCFASAGLVDGGAALLDPVAQQIRNQNSVFPFSYTGQPFGANLTVSLPIFTGFSRSLRLSQARAQEDDAEEEVRARRLQVRTDVHSRYLGLETAFQAIGVQGASREAARDQLRLAQDRYRLGAGAALEVSDAQNAVQQAEGDYVNAVYDYHKAIAALEAAVGRSLR